MKTLSIAISTLALLASNLVSQTVTVTPLKNGIVTYKVCPAATIKDFHLKLHVLRVPGKFDANVRPLAPTVIVSQPEATAGR
jgi:hypothetical protein